MLGSNLETLALARFARGVNAGFEFVNSGPSLVHQPGYGSRGVRNRAVMRFRESSSGFVRNLEGFTRKVTHSSGQYRLASTVQSCGDDDG